MIKYDMTESLQGIKWRDKDMEFTHFDERGKALMVDVTDKNETERCAVAAGKITVSQEVYRAIEGRHGGKGRRAGSGHTAGIMERSGQRN